MRCERNRPGGKNDRQEVDSASLHPPTPQPKPLKAQSYEHRSGRTAVDGEACCVITLVMVGGSRAERSSTVITADRHDLLLGSQSGRLTK